MRLSQRALIWLVSSLACACGGAVDSGLSSDNSGLRAQEADDSEVEASAETDTVPPGTETDTTPPSTGGAEMPVLECPHGGKIGKVVVSFDCDEVTTVSCKALSNVVIEFADGARQRFEGLSETGGTFAGTGDHAGALITRVWIKAGNNFSGDGPGYGERFEAPQQFCDPATPPSDTKDCTLDGSCAPSDTPPTETDCVVVDGSCTQNPPPPPPETTEPPVAI